MHIAICWSLNRMGEVQVWHSVQMGGAGTTRGSPVCGACEHPVGRSQAAKRYVCVCKA